MLKYSVDERPGKKRLPIFGLQHVLTMLGATIAVPTIVASAFSLSGFDTALLISNVLLAMGIATLIQIFFGTRLPIVQGSSFAFLPAILYVGTVHSGVEGLQYVMGAIILGGFVQAFLGFSRIAGVFQKILSPVVIGPTILVIGLSLFKVGGNQAASNWWISILTMLLIVIFSFGLKRKRRSAESKGLFTHVQTFPVILAIVIVWVLCLILTFTGVFSAASASGVNLSVVADTGLVKTSGFILPWGLPKFDLSVLVIFLIAYAVSTIESIGDYNAMNEIAFRDPQELAPETANKGIFAEGIGCVLAGFLGANPTTSYGENIGVVAITGVASRAVVATGAVILIFAGLLPFFGALLSTIPTPVMGGLYCVLFGMIVGVGLRYAAKADLSSMRNISIIGFALFLGFALPSAFELQAAKDAVIATLGQGFGDIVLGFVTSNMGVTAITALILDMTIADEPSASEA